MVIEVGGDDPIREFGEAEKEQLTRALLRLTEQINESAQDTRYDRALVESLHLQLFGGVRDHAGRMRDRDYGEEHLTFGPNRSAAASEVPERLTEHFSMVARLLDDLDKHRAHSDFVEEVIQVAAYVHADFIRIHPFRDGNGRVSRLVMNLILRKYGLPLNAVNVPRQEYYDALNHFYTTKDMEPLTELFIRSYYDQMGL